MQARGPLHPLTQAILARSDLLIIAVLSATFRPDTVINKTALRSKVRVLENRNSAADVVKSTRQPVFTAARACCKFVLHGACP